MEQVIDFVTTDITTTTSYLVDRFQLRTDRGWLWVQRLAFWALKKIGAYAEVETQTFHRHVIQSKSLMDAIHRQHGEIVRLYNQRGGRVLMGSEEFRELVAIEISQPLSFSLSYDWINSRRREIHGMPITVIPWMRGILVVPKDAA